MSGAGRNKKRSSLQYTQLSSNPEDSATNLSKLFFSWLSPLFVKGYEAPLEKEDIWAVPKGLKAEKLANEFETMWVNRQREEALSIRNQPVGPPSSSGMSSMPTPHEEEVELDLINSAFPSAMPESARYSPSHQAQTLDYISPTPAGLSLKNMFSTLKRKFSHSEIVPLVNTSTTSDTERMRALKEKTLTEAHLRFLRNIVFSFRMRRLILAGFLKLFADMASVLTPIVLSYLLIFIKSSQFSASGSSSPLEPAKERPPPPQSLSQGLVYVALLFMLNIINTLLSNAFQHRALVCGIQIRTAISAFIYRKLFKLSSKARRKIDSGKVMNMASIDCVRIETFITQLHNMWLSPLRILIIVSLMLSKIGITALAGIGLLVVTSPLQNLIWKQLRSFRKTIAPITDYRVKRIQEILGGIMVIKLFAWEPFFFEKIRSTRKAESSKVFQRSLFNALAEGFVFNSAVFASCFTFMIYGTEHPLDPAVIFPILAWFNQIRFPMIFLPQAFVAFADFKVAIQRISELLNSPEMRSKVITICDKQNTCAIQIRDGHFSWDATSSAAASNCGGLSSAPSFSLRDINLNISKGQLVAVVGSIGSGKSSLLAAMLGEMEATACHVQLGGSVGYSSQEMWIKNDTVRDNITFGRNYNKNRYMRILTECSLLKDLESFPNGDQTIIGERGYSLSGGQRQRICLARCLYDDADILLLDDPFSALDVHVSNHIFETSLLGSLSSKTRVLATHHLQLLTDVDHIVVMDSGCIVEQGSYLELMSDTNGLLKRMISSTRTTPRRGSRAYSESRGSFSSRSSISSTDTIAVVGSGGEYDLSRINKLHLVKEEEEEGKLEVGDDDDTLSVASVDTLMPSSSIEEERAVGSVKTEIWLAYIKHAGGYLNLMLLIVILVFINVTKIGTDYWLVIWTNNKMPGFTNHGYIAVYAAIAVSQSLAMMALGLCVAWMAIRASRNLHDAALTHVMKAPMEFFNANPLGRIINRFSKDQDTVDNNLSDSIRIFLNTFVSTLSIFALIVSATPMFIIPIIPLLAGYYHLQNLYRHSSRELKRLDSVSQSPLLSHYEETIRGLSTILAYGEEHDFISNGDSYWDQKNATYFLLFSAQRWLGVRLEAMGSFIVMFAALLGVFARADIPPAILGLSLSYAIQVTGTLNFCVRQFTETEIAMNAVERLHHYGTRIKMENVHLDKRSLKQEETKLKNRSGVAWPSTGVVTFQDITLRYSAHLPNILKNISFHAGDKEKVAIVGRSGSGKSSLMQALFRLIEPSSGTILIDGIRAESLSLTELRSGLAIIPQVPVVFTGSFRMNLDPFGVYSDMDLWKALENANLKGKVSKEGGLDAMLKEGGSNLLSIGERQLLCLARAMVRQPKILIMDEASSNIDLQSDIVIQNSIRQNFADATILTIAHRMKTIVDYDKVLVLDDGQMAEFDTPANLLENPMTLFSQLVVESS